MPGSRGGRWRGAAAGSAEARTGFSGRVSAPGPRSSKGVLWTGSHIGVQVPWALAPLRIPSKGVFASPQAAGTRAAGQVLPGAAAAVMLLIKAAGRRKPFLVRTQISFSHSAGNSRQHLPWLRCSTGGSGRVPTPAGPPTRVPCCHRRSRLRARGPSALQEQQPGQSRGQRRSGRPCRALGQLYPPQGCADRHLWSSRWCKL